MREEYVKKYIKEEAKHSDDRVKKALTKRFAIEAIMRAEGRNWCDEDEKLTMNDAKHAVKTALALRGKDQDKMSDIVVGLVNSGMDVFEDGEDLFSEALECVKAYYQSVYEVEQGKAQKAKVRKVKREPVRKIEAKKEVKKEVKKVSKKVILQTVTTQVATNAKKEAKKGALKNRRAPTPAARQVQPRQVRFNQPETEVDYYD